MATFEAVGSRLTGLATSLAARRFSPSIRELARGVVPMLTALGLLNASNYIFHVAVSRLLGPTDYGALASLLAVVMVLSVPLGVVQTVVAKRTAALESSGDDAHPAAVAAATMKGLLPFAVGGLLVLTFAGPALGAFLHSGAGPAALLGPYWLVSLVGAVPLGALQGRLRFRPLAFIAVIGVAARLLLGIGLVWAGAGVTGAVLATVLAQAVSLILAARVVGLRRTPWRMARSSVGVLRGEFSRAFLALASFWLLAEADVVLARHFLEPHESGLYASAGLLARALLFLAAAVSVVALPRFSEARGADEAGKRLRVALGAVCGLALVLYPALVLLRGPVVALAFGDRFAAAAGLVPLLAAGAALLAVLNLLLYFHVAQGTRAYRVTLGAVAAEAVAISLFHDTPEQIGFIVLAVAAATTALQYHAAVAALRRPKQGSWTTDGALARAPTLDVSVVLPCHNAAAGLRRVLELLCRDLEESGSWEVIVVSDGSTDETVAVAKEFAAENVRVLCQPERNGKGQTLRLGLAEARGRYVAFMDADGDIDPGALRPTLALMELYQPDVVLGSKRHPLSQVSYPPLRRVLSWVYHKLCRLLFRVNVRDTQTGLKLMRRDVLAAVLPRMLEKRYAFDLEFLVVARRLGFTRVFEAPIRIDYRFDSQVSPRSASRILLDTLAIFYRRYILDTYGAGGDRNGNVGGVTGRPRHIRTLASSNGHLRILFLNWRDVRNPGAGGAEVVTHEVARRWAEQGHDVSLLTSRFPGGPVTEEVDGVRIRRVGRLRSGTFHLRVQRELAWLRGFDVVIDEINTIPFLTPLWRRRLPPVIALIHQTAGEVWDSELPRGLAALGRSIEPRLLRLYSDVPVVTVSESTRRDLVALGLQDVSVIPNGLDAPPNLNGSAKEPVPTFIFVGRLTANKRPEHAVEAFRRIEHRLPQSRLWIVGEGPLERRLRRDLPHGAQMLGRLRRDELYRRMARAHALLLPSVREGWGLVVVEANSVGTPAVGYNVAGARDSIRDGETGVLAQPGDPAALAEAAVTLVTDRRYPEVCRRAKEWAGGFSWPSTADALMDTVRRVLDTTGAGSGPQPGVPYLG